MRPDVTPQQVVDEALSWLGVPFHHQGRVRCGVDCIGLIVVVRQALGLPVEDMHGYGRTPFNHTLSRELERQMVKLPSNAELKPADVLELTEQGDPHHVAIYTDTGTIIHAVGGSKYTPNRVIESPFRPPWTQRLRGIYRMPEFT